MAALADSLNNIPDLQFSLLSPLCACIVTRSPHGFPVDQSPVTTGVKGCRPAQVLHERVSQLRVVGKEKDDLLRSTGSTCAQIFCTMQEKSKLHNQRRVERSHKHTFHPATSTQQTAVGGRSPRYHGNRGLKFRSRYSTVKLRDRHSSQNKCKNVFVCSPVQLPGVAQVH